MTKKQLFHSCAGVLAEALVGNPSCSAAVWEEVGMPEQTQGFVDKTGSKGHTSYTPYVPEEHPIVELPPGIRT